MDRDGSTTARQDTDGRVGAEHEALWTRLFADWLEEQTALALREIEHDGAEADGGSATGARGRAVDRVSRAR